MSEIAERLMLEPSTLTPLLKRLEASGLVVRRRSAEDERQVLVGLTDKGRALKERATCMPMALMAASGLTPTELGRLNTEVLGLRNALTEDAA